MRRRDPFAQFAVSKKTQLTTKSDQWFDDAKFLHVKAKRYGAALYLGGFVIECLLKAALWDRREERRVWDLLFSHDLTALLELNASLARSLRSDRQNRYEQFVRLSNWNVRVRYNPRPVRKEDADDFMRRLQEVRQWLRNRI